VEHKKIMPKEIKKTITKKTTVKKVLKKKPINAVVVKAKKPIKKIITPKQAIVKAKKIEKEEAVESERYIEAVGRRKTAVARVRLFTKGEKEFLVNDKNYKDYFPNFELQKTILTPLEMMNSEDKFRISVKVKGGGVNAQAGAIRHGISRAMIKFNPDFRKRLKKAGLLTRDPRMRERKKFGLKRARRGPQWSKR